MESRLISFLASLYILSLPALAMFRWNDEVESYLALPQDVWPDRATPSISHFIATPAASGGMGLFTSPVIYLLWKLHGQSQLAKYQWLLLPLSSFTAFFTLFLMTPVVYAPQYHNTWVQLFGSSAIVYLGAVLWELRRMGSALEAPAALLVVAIICMACVVALTPEIGTPFILFEYVGLICIFWFPTLVLPNLTQ